jgi:hypothetical protein
VTLAERQAQDAELRLLVAVGKSAPLHATQQIEGLGVVG